MDSQSFSLIFATFLLITLALKLWLAKRHINFISKHKNSVPNQFAEKISLDAHKKAADYTIAKTRLKILLLAVNSMLLIWFTLFGGLQLLSNSILQIFDSGLTYQICLILAVALISSIVDIPFDYFKQFTLEEKFGFNKMKPSLFFTDLLKNAVVSLIIGLPIIWVILILMNKAGSLWWLYFWFIWCFFQILMLSFYQNLIAPMFNKFSPLEDNSLKLRIEGLMKRVGFSNKGLFVMDGSKRSSHGNAYFSGFGSAKRIVFFDTLISRLKPEEIEAVLAHELGHFKLKHVLKRLIVVFILSLFFLGILGFLKNQIWFYKGLGVIPLLNDVGNLENNDSMALILFMLIIPVFTFLISPIASISSRKHEFEADAFAAKHTNSIDLISALVKLYEDNASTLTPDPIHSAFYDSHPPASLRINKLKSYSS
tara:strand:+ start:265 stop:1542 length:1278 start_codon:yes stop_codon:yes gene_type:complete